MNIIIYGFILNFKKKKTLEPPAYKSNILHYTQGHQEGGAVTGARKV